MKIEPSITGDNNVNNNDSFETRAETDCGSWHEDDPSKTDENKRRLLAIAVTFCFGFVLLLTFTLGVILSSRSDPSTTTTTAVFTPERFEAEPSPPPPVEPNIFESPTEEPSITVPSLEVAPFASPTETPSGSSLATSFPSIRQRQAITVAPTLAPTTVLPTTYPTTYPTNFSTEAPTIVPTDSSSAAPTLIPRFPTATPTFMSNDCAVRPLPPPLPGKKGIGFTLRDTGKPGSWQENLPRVIALRPYWNYKWGLERIEAQPDDIEFVPMVWGSKNIDVLEDRLKEWVVPHLQTGKVKRLLGFNEPDRPKQANMEPEQAIQAWPTLAKLNISLTSPSCAHAEGPWMEAFMAGLACPESVDWVGVHWYGGTSFFNFRNKMTSIYELHGNRPLLITEFAPADWQAETVQQNRHSPAAVLDFMKRALPWLEEQDWIAGYAWFPFDATWPAGTSSSLFDQAGNLTALGRYYASVRSDNPMGDQSITID